MDWLAIKKSPEKNPVKDDIIVLRCSKGEKLELKQAFLRLGYNSLTDFLIKPALERARK